MAVLNIGPYMNEDGDWWVPVEAASFRQARAEVVSSLDYSVPEDGRLRYLGREKQWLDTEHEAGCDPTECSSLRLVDAWHFLERREPWA